MIILLLGLLIFAASAGACEKDTISSDKIAHSFGSGMVVLEWKWADTVGGQVYLRKSNPPSVNTTWFTVDTVEICPEGFSFVRFRNLPGWESWCIPHSNPLLLSPKPTMRIDTIWHLKMQVWMDPSEYDNYLECLEGDSSIYRWRDWSKPPAWRDTIVDELE